MLGSPAGPSANAGPQIQANWPGARQQIPRGSALGLVQALSCRLGARLVALLGSILRCTRCWRYGVDWAADPNHDLCGHKHTNLFFQREFPGRKAAAPAEAAADKQQARQYACRDWCLEAR